jgi:IS30 family transposase
VGYSPEQIAGILALVHSDTPLLQASHETIYIAIPAMPRGELRTAMISWLQFGYAKQHACISSLEKQTVHKKNLLA